MKQTFLRAAEFMDTPDVSSACAAILKCPDGFGAGVFISFRRMFAPDGKNCSHFWFGEPQKYLAGSREQRTRQTRVMALLLAAEAWRDFV